MRLKEQRSNLLHLYKIVYLFYLQIRLFICLHFVIINLFTIFEIMKIYTYNLTVKALDIDALNHVNNVIYLQWINDISILHWNSLSNESINKKYIWVASRHEIDYIKPAFLGEKITINTWIETLEGVKSIRKVEILRNNVLLAKSKTTWVLLNAKTQRLARIPTEILDIFNS